MERAGKLYVLQGNTLMGSKERTEILLEKVARLRQEAIHLGATDAAVITSGDILVAEDLAALCNGKIVCPYYGLAASCPPYVKGPERFKKWQEQSQYAVTVKIELPSAVLFSYQREEVMRLLHEVVAGVELKAKSLGLTKSRAFAGGSCKPLFCEEHEICCVVKGRQPCRYKDKARPSISGFGIDAIRLMETSGWPTQKSSASDDLGWLVGLVLIAQ